MTSSGTSTYYAFRVIWRPEIEKEKKKYPLFNFYVNEWDIYKQHPQFYFDLISIEQDIF